jgi:hypothetical protein
LDCTKERWKKNTWRRVKVFRPDAGYTVHGYKTNKEFGTEMNMNNLNDITVV